MPLKDFSKKYEKDLEHSLVKMGRPKEFIPTGSISLDFILDGGWSRNRVHEIFGENQSGKTTTAIESAKQEQMIIRGTHPSLPQRPGGICFMDYEHALDPFYAKMLGLDMDDKDTFMWLQPLHAAEGCLKLDLMLKEKPCPISFVIIDSLAAMRPAEEMLEPAEKVKHFKGLHARTCTDFFNKYTAMLCEAGVTCLILNQTREGMGSFGGGFAKHEVNWGYDEETTGGSAAKFYFSSRVRLEIYDFKERDFHSCLLGHNTRAKEYVRVHANAVKNKAGAPHRFDYVVFRFGKGIDNYETVCLKAMNFSILQKSGSWYKLVIGTTITEDGKVMIPEKGDILFSCQGEEQLRMKLKDNPEAYKLLRKLVLEKYAKLTSEEIYGTPINNDDVDDAAIDRSVESSGQEGKDQKPTEPSAGKEVVE